MYQLDFCLVLKVMYNNIKMIKNIKAYTVKCEFPLIMVPQFTPS